MAIKFADLLVCEECYVKHELAQEAYRQHQEDEKGRRRAAARAENARKATAPESEPAAGPVTESGDPMMF
jgi:ribosome-binding protein aMBF1 (putative translation factor)